MTITTHESAHLIEQALIDLDTEYQQIYGPNLATWSTGVRGELLDRTRTVARLPEAFPVRPRKSSASRRRRHIKALPFRIHTIAPGAATVLLAPMWTDATGSAEQHFMVTARIPGVRDRLQLPVGGSRRLTALIQSAFPGADWKRPQTWHADTNQLTTWGQADRDFRDSVASGHVEDLDAWAARVDTTRRRT